MEIGYFVAVTMDPKGAENLEEHEIWVKKK